MITLHHEAKTPLQQFADKHDLCEFGRELFARKKTISLEQAWEDGEALCTIFMYVKGVRTSNWMVLYNLADSIRTQLATDGFVHQSLWLEEYINDYYHAQAQLLDRQTSMNRQLLPGKRKESAELHTPQLSVSIARNIALFALDYASQTRYGKFDLKFSYEVARIFRSLVGENPFKGR